MSLAVSLDTAISEVCEHVGALSETECCALPQAHGRVLAAPFQARWDLPSFANAAMDGYALSAGDASAGTRLRVDGLITAGMQPGLTPLQPGHAIAVMTGAGVPPGTHCVIAQEWALRDGDNLVLQRDVAADQNIRGVGEDVREGAVVVPSGRPLDAAAVAMLAQFGETQPRVIRSPRVAVLSCGDELRQPPHRPGPAEVIDCNSPAIVASLAALGARANVAHPVADNPDALEAAVAAALVDNDMLVLVAGASHGVHDFAESVLGRFDVHWLFNSIDIRPGRPAAFGLLPDGRPVFSLPGNPVSALLMFDLLVRPATRCLSGRVDARPAFFRATLDEDMGAASTKTRLVRVVLREDGRGGWYARSAGRQVSGVLSTSVAMDAVAVLEAGVAAGAGASVRVYRPL